MPSRLALLVVLSAVTVLGSGCGGKQTAEPGAPNEPGAQHIHGVGINPADDSVMIATHTGLLRAAPGQRLAKRVGDSQQDTMGFTILGPDKFIGSGHPDERANLPPLLGLISSDDAGRSWTPVSLLGEADFHVLRASGPRVYGYDATRGRVMVSRDGGRTWKQRRPPAPLFDLAVDPTDGDRIVVSSEAGIAMSRDAGQSWRPLDATRAGLLAWQRGAVTLIDGNGSVQRSIDLGKSWTEIGEIGGRPAALSADGGELLVALHTNLVKASSDGGKTWLLRVAAS